MNHNKAALIILDGWGHGQDPSVDAIAQAHTPYMDMLHAEYPNAELVTFGEDVGLPPGQMGNSEVGHLNIGAGRVVFQELARINNAIEDGSLAQNTTLQHAIQTASSSKKRIHLLGLLSDGGVHSHVNHLLALVDIISSSDVEIFIHAFLDGRDTSPTGGKDYLGTLLEACREKATLASVVGRYYAMDRDHRWERIKKAYDLFVHGVGERTDDIIASIEAAYDQGLTDEFMEPLLLDSNGVIEEGDTVLFYNFRTDRPRQLTAALSQKDIPDHDMKTLPLHFFTMTKYDDAFQNVGVIFTKDDISGDLGEVIANAGRTQLRIAETEKYPHVTFFFSGGREEGYSGERRILIPSPKVATYDMQPQMSATEITENMEAHITEHIPDFICCNYANTDMVGHTGDFAAAVAAAEHVDGCLARVIPFLNDSGYHVVIIADHGNSDIMIKPDGTAHTAHTTNMVPIIHLSPDNEKYTVQNGKLADIAPTILSLMNIDIPNAMTGDIIITKNEKSS